MAHDLGMIVLWSGSIATIPSGWTLCDGTLGTPDLRNNFLRGAGGAFNPDDTGGDFIHDHTFTSDGHSHTIAAGTDLSAAGGPNGSTTTIDQATGTTAPGSSLPPFYALAYIMRI